MGAFTDIMIAARQGGTVPIDDSWRQGRAIFGGMGASVALEAASRDLDPDLPLRSVMTSFVAPPGDGDIHTESRLLRAGKSVTQVEGAMVQDGAVLTKVQAAFGADRAVTKSWDTTASSDIPSRDGFDDIPFQPGLMPSFLQYFQVRWVTLPPAFYDPSDTSQMWVRLRDPEVKTHPNAWMLSVCDMPPPIIMLHYDGLIRSSSLSWSLEFVQPPNTIDSDWFFLDYRLDSAAHGYSQQSGRIFDEHGRLVAYSRQCMVYFEPKT